jgi:hypothetical protein
LRGDYALVVHFDVDRSNFHQTRVVNDPRPTELLDGQVLLDLESFAFTATGLQ